MADWIITRAATLQPLFAQLSDAGGPLDLQPGTQVSFLGTPLFQGQPDGSLAGIPTIGGGAVVVRPGATPDDPNRGFVRYDLSSGDIANVAQYKCVWLVLPPGQVTPQAFPQDGNMYLYVKDLP